MKTAIKLAAIFMFAVLLQITCAKADDLGASVEMASIDINALATGRPSKINVWFPKGQCEGLNQALTEKQFCLADYANANKVIVLSHGAMGSVLEYGWIGESLAAAGFIVVGVNHYGESWVYGKAAVNSNAVGFIWQRAQDVSAVLDHLTEHTIFQRKVHWQNAIAIGHSSGGQTAAMLAGATFDLKWLTAYCDATESEGDRSCGYAKASASASESLLALFRAQQKDSRIKMIILIDPALGSAVNPESLHAINLPVLVIGAANNDFLPWKNHGLRYVRDIPNAKAKLLTGQEGHFVFIKPCDHKIKAMNVPLCEDRPGVDRKATQESLAKVLVEFVRGENSAEDEKSAGEEFHKPFMVSENHLSGSISQSLFMIVDIVANTPHWVFGLLAMLVVIGLMQARTRQVPIRVAMIIPVLMLGLSISGVLGTIGWRFAALSIWLLGIAAVTLVYVKFYSQK